MKAKKIFRRFILLTFTTGLLINMGCSKDDPEKSNNLTGIISFGFADEVIKDYPFEVDNVNFTIANKDSLPYQFDASNLTAVFSAIQGSTVTVNGMAQESGVSKNNFSEPVIYTVTAANGTTSKKYEIQLNIAQLNPEAVQWNQASPNAFDAAYTSQEYFYLNGKHFMIVGKPKMEESKLYSSADGKTWSEETITGDFPVGVNHNVVVQNGTAYIVGYLEMTDPYGLGDPQYFQQTLGEDLYTTTDGLTWTKTAGVLTEGEGWSKTYKGRINTPSFSLNGTLYAVGGNTSVFGSFSGGKPTGSLFYPPAGVDGTTLISTDGSTFTASAEYTAEMPKRVFAAHYVYKNAMYIAGGLNVDGIPLSDVWTSTDGVNWTLVSDGAFTPRLKSSTVVHNDKIWMIGGLLADGTCTSEILVSEDAGATWAPVSEEKALPTTFTPRCNANVSVDSNGNLYIMGGEYTEVTTNEDGILTVEYHALTDVWIGKLNKL